MAVWMRLTHLFGLDRDEVPANLMHEALGPILRAAWSDIVEAPVPASMQTLLRQLNRPAQNDLPSGNQRNKRAHHRYIPEPRPRPRSRLPGSMSNSTPDTREVLVQNS
jgi:hypothetical protein